VENWLAAIVLVDIIDVHCCFVYSNKYTLSVRMNSSYFTRSKACRPSQTSDIPSDIEPDDVATETDISGPVRLPVTAVEKLESLPHQLAVPPSAPGEGVDGGIGSESSLFAGVPLSAPGGQIDPH